MRAKLSTNVLVFFMGLCVFGDVVIARGGGLSDGGGNAVVCFHQDGSISSASLLDLYEAAILRSSPPKSSDAPSEVQAREALERVLLGGFVSDDPSNSINSGQLKRSLDAIIADKVLLPPGSGLKPIDDADTILVPPKGCGFYQLAVYQDAYQTLILNGDIWEHLDATNKAALYVHEALYKFMREMGETTSERTRIAVGASFARENFQQVDDGVPQKYWLCWTNSENEKGLAPFKFYAFRNSENKTVYQFLTFAGRLVLSKTAAVVGGNQWPFMTPSEPGGTWTFSSEVNSLIDNGGRFYMQVDVQGGTQRAFINDKLTRRGYEISCMHE